MAEKLPPTNIIVKEVFFAGVEASRWVDTAPILWFGDGAGPPLVLGPPNITDIRLSPAISYRPDGTAFRTSHTVRADHGVALTEVAGAAPGQLSVRFHLLADPLVPPSAVVGVHQDAAHICLGSVRPPDARPVPMDSYEGLLQKVFRLPVVTCQHVRRPQQGVQSCHDEVPELLLGFRVHTNTDTLAVAKG
jgi:hypothetical protein